MLDLLPKASMEFDGFLVWMMDLIWIWLSKGHGNFKVNDCDELQREGIQFIGKRLEGLMAKMQG